MATPTTDPRAVTEYKIPATSLRSGDLLNTSPGGDDDWQQVLSVHTAEAPGADPDVAALISGIGDRYVIVRLTDVNPVDSPVYFDEGIALAYGSEDTPDVPVSELLSEREAVRAFIYTRFELVTVRG